MKYDFSGYATKNDIKCGDGRTIRHNAFKECDGQVVPLVWQHLHDEPTNVLGHALLENREDGVYTYGSFNDTEQGRHAKTLVQHGDISSLSIFANRLQQRGGDVLHGVIREVSLVLAGANPGARIENLSFEHSDGSRETLDEEACIYEYLPIEFLAHADDKEENNQNGSKEENKEADVADSEKTVQDVVDSMNEEQKNVLYFLVGQAAEGEEVEEVEETDEEMAQSEGYGDAMQFHVFDNEGNDGYLSHAEIEEYNSYIGEAQSAGRKLSDVFLSHGITNLDYMFPDAKLLNTQPDMISRKMEWVSGVLNGVKHSPFSRVKTLAADITADEARARGYIKGNKKEEEVFELLKRTTEPQTIYKVQKLDRDDVIDITDIDTVAFMKAEMRLMLDEELARAILVGDGRSNSSKDKIKADKIRPIYGDDDLYTIYQKVTLNADATNEEKSDALIEAAIRARKNYKGAGNPTFYATNDVITDMLLAKDGIGRRLYSNLNDLAAAMRVKDIVEVPVMEGTTRKETIDTKEHTYALKGLIVNLSDYNVGADKGGEVNLFDDFDLDYNKLEYLIETRCSGALAHPFSAIAIEEDTTPASSETVG